MKCVAATLILCGFALGAEAADDSVTIYETFSCGDFVAKKDITMVRHAVGSYARGFFSAANIHRADKKRIDGLLTDNVIALYLEKYCRDNPLHNVSFGVARMAGELAK